MIYSRVSSYSYKSLVKSREYTVSIFVKMPFARSNETGKIISITEANRGNACNCRCLSCNTPVTARKADRTWHFSHRTDKTSRGLSTNGTENNDKRVKFMFLKINLTKLRISGFIKVGDYAQTKKYPFTR